MLQSIGAPAGAFAAFAALFAYASWRAALPADPLKPRMAPWRTISVIAGVGAMLAFLLALAQLRGPS